MIRQIETDLADMRPIEFRHVDERIISTEPIIEPVEVIIPHDGLSMECKATDIRVVGPLPEKASVISHSRTQPDVP